MHYISGGMIFAGACTASLGILKHSVRGPLIISLCMYIYIYIYNIYIYIYTLYIYIYIYIYIYLFQPRRPWPRPLGSTTAPSRHAAEAPICVYILYIIYIYIYYIYIYTHTYTHTCTHTCTYIYIYRERERRCGLPRPCYRLVQERSPRDEDCRKRRWRGRTRHGDTEVQSNMGFGVQRVFPRADRYINVWLCPMCACMCVYVWMTKWTGGSHYCCTVSVHVH